MYEIFENLLTEKAITAYQVAKATGVSTVTLSNWKKGKYKPKEDKLQKIADYLGVQLDFLLGKTEYKTTDEMIGARSKSVSVTEPLVEYDVITMAAHKVGHEGDLTEEEREDIELAIQVALAKHKNKR